MKFEKEIIVRKSEKPTIIGTQYENDITSYHLKSGVY